MSFESFNIVYYTSLFILPGYIIEEITSAFIPIRIHSDWVKAIRCLLYSLINCAASSWAYILITEKYTDDNPLYWLLGLAITLIISFILGIIIGIFKKINIIRKLFGLCKIQLAHPVPTAWDYKFSNLGTRYVIIDLKDGSIIYGKYSNNSFSSSIPEERDIYIEEVYTYSDGQPWMPVPRNDGIIVKWDDIQEISFFYESDIQMKGDNNNRKRSRKKSKRKSNDKRVSTNGQTG